MFNDVWLRKLLGEVRFHFRALPYVTRFYRHQTPRIRYTERFEDLSDEEVLDLLKMFERFQSLTIRRGVDIKDSDIHVPCLGRFGIKEIRRDMVDSGAYMLSKEERINWIKERYSFKKTNPKVKRKWKGHL